MASDRTAEGNLSLNALREPFRRHKWGIGSRDRDADKIRVATAYDL